MTAVNEFESQRPPLDAPEPEPKPKAPDWLTASAKFQQAGRPKPRAKSSYAFHPRKGK